MSPIYLILLFVLFGLFAALLIHGQAQVKKKVALEDEREMQEVIDRWDWSE